jgi:hypothetical protein
VQEDRARRSAWRIGRERIVGHQDRFVADSRVPKALSARVTRVLTSDEERSAPQTQRVGISRRDRSEHEGRVARFEIVARMCRPFGRESDVTFGRTAVPHCTRVLRVAARFLDDLRCGALGGPAISECATRGDPCVIPGDPAWACFVTPSTEPVLEAASRCNSRPTPRRSRTPHFYERLGSATSHHGLNHSSSRVRHPDARGCRMGHAIPKRWHRSTGAL